MWGPEWVVFYLSFNRSQKGSPNTRLVIVPLDAGTFALFEIQLYLLKTVNFVQ